MKERMGISSAFYRIRSLVHTVPSVGLILGSGLGDFCDTLEDPVVIPFSDIPGFPVSTVEGHTGAFVFGRAQGKYVVALRGRVHYYEGYTPQQIVMPVRVMAKLGVKTLILTNAAGGVDPDWPAGTLMLIKDHINYSGMNPLIGPNLEDLGPRFPDMSDVYSRELREKLKPLAAAEGIRLEEGVYVMFSGPSYETPAEVRFARIMGGDAVGMSTVPEAIAARHCGLQVMGVSCITNLAAGMQATPLDHSEVVETANRVKAEFTRLLRLMIDIA